MAASTRLVARATRRPRCPAIPNRCESVSAKSVLPSAPPEHRGAASGPNPGQGNELARVIRTLCVFVASYTLGDAINVTGGQVFINGKPSRIEVGELCFCFRTQVFNPEILQVVAHLMRCVRFDEIDHRR